jgi:hypothetical protein
MFSQKQIEKKIGSSPLVFVGTVKRTGASNLRALKANDQLALIEINTVATVPKAFIGITGTTVTVKLPAKTKLKKGDTRVFYAKGLLHGENLALEATSIDTVDADHSLVVKRVRDARTNIERNERLRHVNNAVLIVEGRVVRMEEADINKYFPLHHKAPFWISVSINIAKIIKGKYDGKSIAVFINKAGEEKTDTRPEVEIGKTGVWMIKVGKILKFRQDDRDFFVIEEKGDFLQSYEYAIITKTL